MEQTVKDELDAIVAKDSWTIEDHDEILKQLASVSNAPASFRQISAQLEAETTSPTGAAALKIGIARYMLCRFEGALEALSEATDNKDRRYFQGLCHSQLHHYDKAVEELQRAVDKGAEEIRAGVAIVEAQALAGDLDGAHKTLDKLAGKIADSADQYYLRGLVEELSGEAEQAEASYEKAHECDSDHAAATFRLAYHYDLHGDEEQAIKLYQECLKSPPVRANAYLNLAVLYEDLGRYEQAATCLRNVLACNPSNERARLFLKDVEASKTMYYDEDQARRIARRNAVLDIPVTDFELSVRARNCLKKMNIKSLGDLVNITEAELLSYKNFGETSLKEIKDMLTAKNLRLGQALEEGGDFPLEARLEPEASPVNEGVLATTIDKIEFSVRARRALESLKIDTLGELVSKTEAELMGCRNFGQTSLNEIRQRLAEFGLQLRESV